MRAIHVLFLIAVVGCGSVVQPGGDGDGDGGPIGCALDSDCPTETPLCGDDEICRGCERHEECESVIGGNFCDSNSGQCVACIENLHCAGNNAPICDATENICRGCVNNSECTSGVCFIDNATCVDETNVVYVDNRFVGSGAPPAGGCGTRAYPCNLISEAVEGRLASPSGGAWRYMLIAPSSELYSESPIPGSLYVVAEGVQVNIGSTSPLSFTAIGDVIWTGGIISQSNPSLTGMIGCDGSGIGTTRLTFRGVEFRDAPFAAIDALDCALEVHDSSFVNNGSGIFSRGLNSRARIERNRFTENHGILVQVDADALIRNNLMTANNGLTTLIRVQLQGGAAGASISYNTIVGNDAGGQGQISCDSSNLVSVSSNIIWDLRDDTKRSFPDGGGSCGFGFVKDNVLDPATLGGTNVDPGVNVISDPLFVSPDNGNFRLTPNSPAVDRGDELFASPTDLNGAPRATGDRPDIGAIEHVPL